MKFSAVKKNPINPRFIRDERFAQLVRSIVEFPEMLRLRPIVVDDDLKALGGNMRFEALKSLFKNSFEDVFPEEFSDEQTDYRRRCYTAIRRGEFLEEWLVKASSLTEDQKQEFVIKDNIPFGSWDDDLLANNFTDFPLDRWGLDFVMPESLDISAFFETSAPVSVIEPKQTIHLQFTADEFERVSPALLKHGKTYEQAVWKLLGL